MGVALTHARNEHTNDYAYETYYGYGDEHTPSAPNAGALPVRARQDPAFKTGDAPSTAV